MTPKISLVVILSIVILAGCKKEVTTGTIEGIVSDTVSLAHLQNAEITIVPGSAVATTNANGKYVIDLLEPQEYEVIVSRSGYLLSSRKVLVSIGMTSKADFGLIEHITPGTGLAAYYPLNSNTNDESGHTNDLGNFGTTSTTNRKGESNKALFFNNPNYIGAPDTNMFNSPGSAFSISLWSKTNSIDVPWPTLLNKLYQVPAAPGVYIFRGFYLGINQETGSYRWRVNNDFIESPVSLNQWQHLVVTLGNNTIKLYVDGKLKQSMNIVMSRYSTSTPFRMGRDSRDNILIGVSYHNGSLDDIRVYNRMLSDIEVIQLFNE